MLPAELSDAPVSDVQRVFGRAFVDALHEMPVGRWQGPVRSGFGVHLVRVLDRVPEQRTTLEQARPEIERDLLQARAAEASATYFEKLRVRYRVRVEPAEATTADAR